MLETKRHKTAVLTSRSKDALSLEDAFFLINIWPWYRGFGFSVWIEDVYGYHHAIKEKKQRKHKSTSKERKKKHLKYNFTALLAL